MSRRQTEMKWWWFFILCAAAGIAIGGKSHSQEEIIGSGWIGEYVPVGYQGVGNVNSGASGYWGVRAYSSSQLSGTTKAFNLRRASDNATCDFDINTLGNLGGTDSDCGTGTGLSLATFATQDATATCTISTTTATCSGASSTPHAGSTITGAGLTQPCWASAVGSFTGGAGTVTVTGTGTSPCGTISVGETLTFTYGLYVTSAYDQTGAGRTMVQATTGNQPKLLPTCLNSLPCMAFLGGTQNLSYTATLTTTSQNLASIVSNRTAVGSGPGYIQCSGGGDTQGMFGSTTNLVEIYAGIGITETATDAVWHAFQGQFGGATGGPAIAVDGTDYLTGSLGAQTWCGTGISGTWYMGYDLTAYVAEAVVWLGGTSDSTIRGKICHNQSLYYGSPSC